MKYYIDFIDGLGSDNTIRLDGRLSVSSMKRESQIQARRKRFVNSAKIRHCQIIAGENLLFAKPITEVFQITVDRENA